MKNKKIIVMDSRYGKKIIDEIKELKPELIHLVDNNIKNPLKYLKLILKEKPEFILLSNRFWDKFLGAELMLELRKLENTDYQPVIICISDQQDFWLKMNFAGWESSLVKGFLSTKSGKDIIEYIENL